ncbi:ferredoxin [Actinorhabdospora filicis]|uniref:Ferredoxin n=1 Tax=Actinorhabdospora filicis TaxID=1785913 RepID=A0A9W6SIP8_9ACTN|nr:ferredoxin [Actinorhabdospora filicis]GLZ76692.1 ferredoxin [Actinorhabdospora filicis]
MNVEADRERCCGSGMCALTAPDVFDQDAETGYVLVLLPEPPREWHDDVRSAAGVCPSGAITVRE